MDSNGNQIDPKLLYPIKWSTSRKIYCPLLEDIDKLIDNCTFKKLPSIIIIYCGTNNLVRSYTNCVLSHLTETAILNFQTFRQLSDDRTCFVALLKLWAVMDATANESLTDMQIRQVGISEGDERDRNISSITDALEVAKLILLPEMLSLLKNDFLTKVDEFCPDTETL